MIGSYTLLEIALNNFEVIKENELNPKPFYSTRDFVFLFVY